MPDQSGEFVQSLERGLAVIRAFDAEHPALTLSEVAARTGLNRAAARRFLLTLVRLGYVHGDGTRFSLRPSVLDLGYAYLSGLSLPEVALPHLERLAERTRESSSVSELDGSDIIYLARVPTRRIMTVRISVGTRFPAYATSMGRVLLAGLPPDRLAGVLDPARLAEGRLPALTPKTRTDPGELRRELDRVREQGWALVDQELELGLRSLAAPIRSPDGTVLAAVNISTHAAERTVEQIGEVLLPPLLETAATISADLTRTGGRR